MIQTRSAREIECMRRAGAVVAEVLARCEMMAQPGMTLAELDREAEAIIRSRDGIPLFKGYQGFPATLCASINEEVVHGIPGTRKLCEGEILSLDCGVKLEGYCGDAAVTVAIGEVSEEARNLIMIARTALERGIKAIKAGGCVSAISRAIQMYVESHGCSVVEKYSGHGIGREMHEEPQVPNFVSRMTRDPVLEAGAVVAIEPMVNLGRPEVERRDDGWTVVTKDGMLSAHYEHTIAVTMNGPDILTAPLARGEN